MPIEVTPLFRREVLHARAIRALIDWLELEYGVEKLALSSQLRAK
jgi:hypothetical protein